MADEQSKREEDRINRTLNNIGRRGPRPTSWNVPQSHNLQGNVGSIGRGNNAAAMKSIQEQIREEEKKYQQQQAQQPQQQQPASSGLTANPASSVPPIQPSMSAQPTQSPFTGGSVLGEVEDDAEKERKMRLEEERLERWMKKGDSRFEENKVVPDARKRSISVDSAGNPDHVAAATTALAATKITDLAVKFQDQVYQASRALRQKKPEDVIKHSFNAALTAKAIAESLSDDPEIFSHARALESGVSTMRTSVDSGGDGQQYYNEVASYLGQLFVSTIGSF